MIRPRTFRQRLVLLMGLTSGVAVALACGVFVVVELVRFRQTAVHNMTSQARVLAIHSAAALSFKDPAAAAETLGAMRAIPTVASVSLHDDQGRLFARYQATEHTPPSFIPENVDPRFTGRWLVVQQPVVHDGRHLGALVLVHDMEAIYRRWLLDLGLAFAVGLAALVAGFLTAIRLQRQLAAPVEELARVAEHVAQTGNYSVRAVQRGDDELGRLTVGVNQMLDRIDRQNSELQQAHDLFQSAVEAAPNAMLMVDEDGDIVLVNAQAERLFGYSREEMVGRSVEMLVPGRFKPQHPVYREQFFAAPAARPMGAGRELFANRKDGTEVPVEIALNPVHTRAGMRVLSAIVDITERKRAEQALRRTNQELQQRNMEMEQFVYSVSHDLKSPLVTIVGFVSVLEQDLKSGRPEDVQEALRHIHLAATRMSQLITDLLKLTRAGRMAAEPERVDSGEVVTQVFDHYSSYVHDCKASIHISPHMPILLIDRSRLMQVFENLIGNALKYGCTHAQPHIRIGSEQNGDEVRFYVADNGQGIDPRFHDKVFGLFQRLDNRAEGTGVGLAIVMRIAEFYGGRAWVESEPGSGATFWVAFPAAMVLEPAESR